MKLLLLSQDLMLTARTEGVARRLGLTLVSQCNLVAAELDACQLIVIDLTLPGLDPNSIVEQVRPVQIPIVACAPHVHEARLSQAREAGCDLVVSRGQWDRDAEKLCQELLANFGKQ